MVVQSHHRTEMCNFKKECVEFLAFHSLESQFGKLIKEKLSEKLQQRK
jgi:hypothetical protein